MKSTIILIVSILQLFLLPTWKAAILRRGNPLAFNQAKTFFNYIRKSGVTQFANHYSRVKDVKTLKFLWGDELEYGIFAYNEDTKSYDIATCRGVDIQTSLEQLESKLSSLSYGNIWQPEYGSWMVETVPRGPYDGFASTLLSVERSMQLRRKRLHSALRPNEIAPSLTAFPMLGVRTTGLCGNITVTDSTSSSQAAVAAEEAALQANNSIAMSCYIRDDAINPHPRFTTLTKNIRLRRGKKVNINIPKEDSNEMIHMDAMAFGMGCCCLQITMQSSSDRESRFLHDQLAILSPFFLALSAATPILKGQLAATDTRWDTISQAVDDRTAAESGEVDITSGVALPDPELAGNGVKRLSKSRYSSVSRFIGRASSSEEADDLERLNDIDANFDAELYKYATSFPDIDQSLARHIAHLFTRDPLVIFEDAIYLDDQRALDHFENIQSTNWRTIRWKTPSLEIGLEQQKRNYEKNPFLRFAMRKSALFEGENDASKDKPLESLGPGWRVEFRPMEIQLTDFENAALSILLVLFTRTILAMGYNLYMPISYVEENMRRAQLKDAVTDQKFYFRRNSFDVPPVSDNNGRVSQRMVPKPSDIDIVEVTLDEIFNGSFENNMKGIIPAVMHYLHSLGTCEYTLTGIHKYLTFLSKRASGELPTAAKWMRSYVKSHPKYSGNGVVSHEVANDLLQLCNDIGMGRVRCPELHGECKIDRLCVEDAVETYLDSSIDDTQVKSQGQITGVESGVCNDGVKEDLSKTLVISDAYLG